MSQSVASGDDSDNEDGFTDDDDETDAGHIQADAFKALAKHGAPLVGPAAEGFARGVGSVEADPKTLKELLESLRRSFYKVVGHAAALPGDIAHAARGIVRGIAQIPVSIADRLRGAHEEADEREAKAQEQELRVIEQRALPGPADPARSKQRLIATEPLAGLLECVKELRAHGIPLELRMVGDSLAVIAMEPEQRALGVEAAKRLLTFDDTRADGYEEIREILQEAGLFGSVKVRDASMPLILDSNLGVPLALLTHSSSPTTPIERGVSAPVDESEVPVAPKRKMKQRKLTKKPSSKTQTPKARSKRSKEKGAEGAPKKARSEDDEHRTQSSDPAPGRHEIEDTLLE